MTLRLPIFVCSLRLWRYSTFRKAVPSNASVNSFIAAAVATMGALLACSTSARANVCEAAAVVAEREARLPPGILAAIGHIESGGRGSMTNASPGWPWTINSLGQGQYFLTKEEAVAQVRMLLLSGVRSIDVGCFQINLQWHPAAFPSLEAAFDPAVNARGNA